MQNSIAKLVVLVGSIALASACSTTDETDQVGESNLELTANDATTFSGSFTHAGSIIEFTSTNMTADQLSVHVNINGAAVDMEMDTAAGTMSQDGHLNAFYREDLAALLALRDAVLEQYPDDVMTSMHVKTLVKYVDRLAEAPTGTTFGQHFVDVAAERAALADRNNGSQSCGNDGTQCLNGGNYNGWHNAFFDKGNGGQCYYWYVPYGKAAPDCEGRCGSGCAWYDKEATQDCLDHDWCVNYFGGSSGSGSSDCGDEYWDASGDWFVTNISYC